MTDPFVGTFFSIGEFSTLLSDSVETKITERIYKISKATPYQYIVDVTDVTNNFSLKLLLFKANGQLSGGSTGNGIDQILFENGDLVAYFSGNENGKIANGRYVLDCKK